MKCMNCRRTIREADVRGGDVPASRHEPAHYDPWAGCRYCLPEADELDAAADAAAEHRGDLMRDGDEVA